ncbi:ABC-three component system protein [Mycolicibacterium lutetiense]
MAQSTRPSAAGGLDLADLPPLPDAPVLSTSHFAGPRLTPLQIIRTYSGTDWEEFVLEWAHCLEGYYEVKRHGGAGDRGLDVVGIVGTSGLSGVWDGYQCKHYAKSLAPADAYIEMAKVILASAEGAFNFPRRYQFVAPLGCGNTLERLLSDPAELKNKFLAKVNDDKPFNDWDRPTRNKIAKTAEHIDFSAFGSEQLLDVLQLHSEKSPLHTLRFGGPLPTRPSPQTPPKDTHPSEARYVSKLVAAYQESLNDYEITPSQLGERDWFRDHLWRQRSAFFSAESLRVFARDQVPPGTFEDLQSEVYDGVVEVEQADHPNGLTRLSRVLEIAGSLGIDENALISVWKQSDRKGICHQLANDDRLDWVRHSE